MTHTKHEPIYVIGAPRSGNTLVGCLLNKHHDSHVLFLRSTFGATNSKWRCMIRLKHSMPEDASRKLLQIFWNMLYRERATYVLHSYLNKGMYRSWLLSSGLASWLRAKWP